MSIFETAIPFSFVGSFASLGVDHLFFILIYQDPSLCFNPHFKFKSQLCKYVSGGCIEQCSREHPLQNWGVNPSLAFLSRACCYPDGGLLCSIGGFFWESFAMESAIIPGAYRWPWSQSLSHCNRTTFRFIKRRDSYNLVSTKRLEQLVCLVWYLCWQLLFLHLWLPHAQG